MRSLAYFGSSFGLCFVITVVFWSCFGACIDAPAPDTPPIAKIVTTWDPLVCGPPHRVVVELEDEAGIELSTSAVCALGSVVLDAPHFGLYRGRIYAWEQLEDAPEIRSVMPIRLTVDEPIVRWFVATPQ
jgi:hypothetical protein